MTPVSFAYQWQQSSNNVVFTDLTGQTLDALPAGVTVAGTYYRVVITPNDGQTNGAPFITASVQVLLDSDNNGLNDDWEVKYFGHIGVPLFVDADGDGMGNLDEFLAGTDPTNADSVLRITSVTANDSNVVVSFTTCSNKLYELEANDDLTTANWSAVVTNIPGTGSIVSTMGGVIANLSNRYYRVRLTSLSTPVDTDGDGLPDGWELQYFGNLSQTDTDDPDGDGFSNLQEFLAGTDPTDFGSALRITSITADGADILINFTTCSSRFYELQSNDDLTTSNWATLISDVLGTGGIVSIADLGGGNQTNRFYRVKLRALTRMS